MGAVASLFPAYSQADWRKAAQAALKDAALESLVSETADGVRIEPVYPPADGPRAIRPGGPWRVIARVDHPDAAEANAQALEDLEALRRHERRMIRVQPTVVYGLRGGWEIPAVVSP